MLDDTGVIFSNNVENLLVYGHYVENLRAASIHLQHLTATNAKFAEFLDKANSQVNGEIVVLRDLLRSPLTHMEAYAEYLEVSFFC